MKLIEDLKKEQPLRGVGFSQFMGGLAELAVGAPREAIESLRQAAAAFDEVRQQENRGWALDWDAMAASLLSGSSPL